jgi:calcineurin-like phosphoesterase family protein
MLQFMFERPLKLTHNDDHKVFFTSDSHFNHKQKFIYEARGYKSVEEHNDALIAKINELVRPQDTLIHLGDFCLNITPPEFNEILARINCNNILYIWGNHNSCIRRYYEDAVRGHLDMVRFNGEDSNEGISVYPYTVGKLTFLGYYKEIIVNGHMIVIHHFPHLIWNQMQKSAWQLSGHSHYTNPTTQIENVNNKILDVGWDGHCKPLSFPEIQKIMMNKNHVKRDSHH